MTAAHEYDDLHRLVDRLTPGQARALRAVALELVDGDGEPDTAEPRTPGQSRRRLSFIGLMEAEPDLAAQSEEILRAELGRRP